MSFTLQNKMAIFLLDYRLRTEEFNLEKVISSVVEDNLFKDQLR